VKYEIFNENARGGQQQPSTANAASSAAVGDLVVLEALPPKPIILTTKPKPKALKDKVTGLWIWTTLPLWRKLITLVEVQPPRPLPDTILVQTVFEYLHFITHSMHTILSFTPSHQNAFISAEHISVFIFQC
jgi:hypothetical protein